MDRKLWIGKVHIMEWLGPGDSRTGRDLYDELDLMALTFKPPIAVAYHRISTRAEFIATLRKIEEDLRATAAPTM